MHRPHSILIVQEESSNRTGIRRCLERRNLECWEAKTSSHALRFAEVEPPDLIVLDLDLPDESGLALCRQVREHDWLSPIPIVALSSRSEEADRILAYEAGVASFLPKPYFEPELAARVGAILRRNNTPVAPPPRHGPIEVRDLRVDPREGLMTLRGRSVKLTPVELAILVELAGADGRVIRRDQLIETLWSRTPRKGRTIDAHVKSIRRKLGPDRDCIQTVRGVGYRFSSEHLT